MPKNKGPSRVGWARVYWKDYEHSWGVLLLVKIRKNEVKNVNFQQYVILLMSKYRWFDMTGTGRSNLSFPGRPGPTMSTAAAPRRSTEAGRTDRRGAAAEHWPRSRARRSGVVDSVRSPPRAAPRAGIRTAAMGLDGSVRASRGMPRCARPWRACGRQKKGSPAYVAGLPQSGREALHPEDAMTSCRKIVE